MNKKRKVKEANKRKLRLKKIMEEKKFNELRNETEILEDDKKEN